MKVSVETQADCWADIKALGNDEKKIEEMETKLFQLDLYIDELQEELKQVREERSPPRAEDFRSTWADADEEDQPAHRVQYWERDSF